MGTIRNRTLNQGMLTRDKTPDQISRELFQEQWRRAAEISRMVAEAEQRRLREIRSTDPACPKRDE